MSARTTELPQDDLAALARFRQDVKPMSYRTQVQGRMQLMAESQGPPRGRALALRPSRRAVLAGAAAVTLGVGFAGSQLTGLVGGTASAQAATVLLSAASAAASTAEPAPRPGQFVYARILRVTGDGMAQRVETWTSADGSRPGQVRSVGFLGKQTSRIEPYSAADGLRSAPYQVLAELPADPDALLARIYADPAVATDVSRNKATREVAAWGLIRDLVERVPASQRAALFEAAAKVRGITYQQTATDAGGRSGEAVGLLDPRLGTVRLIFDRQSHVFLGESILTRGSNPRVEFTSSVQRVAAVDTLGQRPAGDDPGPAPQPAPTRSEPLATGHASSLPPPSTGSSSVPTSVPSST